MIPSRSHFPDKASVAPWAVDLFSTKLAEKCCGGCVLGLCHLLWVFPRALVAGVRLTWESAPCRGTVDFPPHFLHRGIPSSVQNDRRDPHLGEEDSDPRRSSGPCRGPHSVMGPLALKERNSQSKCISEASFH